MTKICNFIGGIFINENKKMYIKTVNPALGEYFNKSILWRGTLENGKIRNLKFVDIQKYKNRVTRASYCHEYIGQSISGYEELLLPINEMRNKHIITLF
jgi:hypothetical protein